MNESAVVRKVKHLMPLDSGQVPVWKGPEVEGVTQSMLRNFLQCRERFRVKVIEGLRDVDKFHAPIEYGNLWHTCEEALANNEDWKQSLDNYAKQLSSSYRTQGAEVLKWYNVCCRQFPHYIKYWEEYHKTANHFMSEEVFCVPFSLPSGRTVKLRGKFDSVYKDKKKIYLQENKTKGQIDEEHIDKQLTFDLQAMTYLTALQIHGITADGVCYNVVRRPLSGGKGSIRQKKEESLQEYYDRLEEYFVEDPDYWFMRWEIKVTQKKIKEFSNLFLIPVLEQLCDWYEEVCQPNRKHNYHHYRFPYGASNITARGGVDEIDYYLLTGSKTGLTKVDNLFPELN